MCNVHDAAAYYSEQRQPPTTTKTIEERQLTRLKSFRVLAHEHKHERSRLNMLCFRHNKPVDKHFALSFPLFPSNLLFCFTFIHDKRRGDSCCQNYLYLDVQTLSNQIAHAYEICVCVRKFCVVLRLARDGAIRI